MAKVKVVKKKVSLTREEIVKYQVITACFMQDVRLSNNELDCLTLLALTGEQDLANFCNSVVDVEIFKSPQTVRNFLNKASKTKLVAKIGTIKKKVKLNEDLHIQTEGNIVLDYTMAYVSKES